MTHEEQAIQALQEILALCEKSDTEDVKPWRILGDIHSITETALQEIQGQPAAATDDVEAVAAP